MRLTSLYALSVASLLSACGGEDDYTPVTFNPDTSDGVAERLVTYADGSGVVVLTETVNGTRVQTTSHIADVDNIDLSASTATVFTNVVSESSPSRGEYYTASATTNGTTRNILVYELDNGEALFALAEGCSGPCVTAGGIAPTSLPEGIWTYNGQFAGHFEGTSTAASSIDPDGDVTRGDFALVANFETSSAVFTAASTDTNDISSIVAADLTIDNTSGELSGSGTAVLSDGNAWNVDMHGSFHGDDATSVSGVLNSTEQISGSTGQLEGAFAGNR